MRLIDANELLKTIAENAYIVNHASGTEYGMTCFGIMQAIGEAKAIDAVPVIRCQECKNYMVDRLWGFSTCGLNGTKRKPNFYCADAKRKAEQSDQESDTGRVK